MSRTAAPSTRTVRSLGTVAATAALTTVLAAGSALAATGDLDPTWSGDGLATQTGGASEALASAVQPDGRLVVAGTGAYDDASVSHVGTYVSRYLPTGELDPTYGTGGVSRVNVVAGFESVRSVVVDSAGRALVGGYYTAPDYPDESDVFVLRLDPSGRPDPTFGGGDGIVTIDRTNHDRGGVLALAGNRILVGTGLDAGGNWGLQWTVFALNGSGALDTTFSGDGQAEVPVAKVGSFDSLRGIAVQADGKIVLGGGSGRDFASARLTAAGALDATYDGDGVARAVVEGGGTAYRLLVQADKKVVVVGSAFATGRSDTDVAAVRWTAAGKLDTSFSGDGRALVDLGGRLNDEGLSASLAPDGKTVVVGSTATGGDSAVLRLDWDGTPDTSFSGDGIAVTSTLATSNERYDAVSVDAAGAVRAFGGNLNGWTLNGYSGGASTNLSVADVRVVEGRSGTTAATFTVSLSAPSPTPVTVRYATKKGTAVTPADFTTRTGTVTFAPGATTATVSVPVVGDAVREADETFGLVLSLPTNAGIADGTAVGTIVNDD